MCVFTVGAAVVRFQENRGNNMRQYALFPFPMRLCVPHQRQPAHNGSVV